MKIARVSSQQYTYEINKPFLENRLQTASCKVSALQNG